MKINMKNLIIARDGLMGLDPEMFDMETYRKDANGKSTDFVNKNDCGTVGCAIGWCPFIPGLEAKKEDNFKSWGTLSFYKYSERVFGMRHSSPVWEYLFGSTWADRDNTIEGLISRMSNVIEGKKKLSNGREW